jgi:hypothetical protein
VSVYIHLIIYLFVLTDLQTVFQLASIDMVGLVRKPPIVWTMPVYTKLANIVSMSIFCLDQQLNIVLQDVARERLLAGCNLSYMSVDHAFNNAVQVYEVSIHHFYFDCVLTCIQLPLSDEQFHPWDLAGSRQCTLLISEPT